MKKQTLKFAGVLCALAMMFSLPAHALKNGFSLKIPPSQAYWVYSAVNPKNDNEQKAYVTITSMTNAASVNTMVTDAAHNPYTSTRVLGKGSYTIPYTTYAPANKSMCLAMTSTTQLDYATITGVWNS